MVIYSPSSSFIAIAAIIPLLCFIIFSAYNSSICAIIVGIRVGIRVVVGLKRLGSRLRLRSRLRSRSRLRLRLRLRVVCTFLQP
jgi:predicted lysophospholipase L1 biosynthesis ABC-type transport system permease subunit